MKKILYMVLGFATLFTFSACEDVVQIKLDEGSKLYVIDAFINDLPEPQTVRITNNSGYFSNAVAPAVPNASVVLHNLRSGQHFDFAYTSDGRYLFTPGTTDSLGKAGDQYELRVHLDGYVYTSLTTQKRTAGIDSLSYSILGGDGGGFGGPPMTDTLYLCELWAKDRADNNPDYYWIKTFRNDTLMLSGTDLNLAIDGTNGAVTNVPVDSTDFTPPITFLGFRFYQPGNTCRVEIHSLARETYYFFTQAAAQVNNGGLFATTPENVKTNIITPLGAVKAVGWFNMATVASKKIKLPD